MNRNSEVLFTEKQRFRQWWIWLALFLANGALLYRVYSVLINNQQPADTETIVATLVVTALALLVAALLYYTRLETIIKKDGIYVRFLPFHFKFKRYSWDILTKSYVRTYNPILEYGGWGLRFGLIKKGIAYNVSGNQGLQLEFNNGKKLLIGTNKPDEIISALIQIEKYKD